MQPLLPVKPEAPCGVFEESGSFSVSFQVWSCSRTAPEASFSRHRGCSPALSCARPLFSRYPGSLFLLIPLIWGRPLRTSEERVRGTCWKKPFLFFPFFSCALCAPGSSPLWTLLPGRRAFPGAWPVGSCRRRWEGREVRLLSETPAGVTAIITAVSNVLSLLESQHSPGTLNSPGWGRVRGEETESLWGGLKGISYVL